MGLKDTSGLSHTPPSCDVEKKRVHFLI
jgi:hypothetical protein